MKLRSSRAWPLVLLPLAACGTGMSGSAGLPESNAAITAIGSDASHLRLNEKAVTESELPVLLARAWKELPLVYDSLGIELEYADPRKFELGNSKIVKTSVLGKERLSVYLRCGLGPGGDLADTHRVTMSINTSLHKLGPEVTRVVTRIQATAAPLYGSISNTVSCASTGKLEGFISDGVLHRIIPPKPKTGEPGRP